MFIHGDNTQGRERRDTLVEENQHLRIPYPKLWNSQEWRNKIRTAQLTVTAEAEISNIGLVLLRLEPVNTGAVREAIAL